MAPCVHPGVKMLTDRQTHRMTNGAPYEPRYEDAFLRYWQKTASFKPNMYAGLHPTIQQYTR